MVGDLAWLDILLGFMFNWGGDLVELGGDGYLVRVSRCFGWVGDSVMLEILVGLDI